MTEFTENPPILDIAIVGAGPGGLSAAHALANRGFSVGVFERAKTLRPIGAALGLAEQGYQALSEINPDLSVQVRAKAANPERQLLMRPNGEVLFSDESPLAGSSFTWLGWYSLQTCLRQMLPDSVHLYLDHKLIDFTNTDRPDAPICLDFENQRYRFARVLIGADGYHSAVRNITVGDGLPLYTGTMTWRGIVPRQLLLPLAEPFDRGAGFQLVVGDQKNFWMMDAGESEIAWAGTALQSTANKSDSALDTVLEVFDGWIPIVEQMIRATDPESIIETGVFDREPVNQWGDGNRVTLLGDAAHPIRPSLGLGTTLAFQDGVALAKSLDGVNLQDLTDVAQAIESYEQGRIAITSPLQQKARHQGTASHDEDRADIMKKGFEAALAQRRQ